MRRMPLQQRFGRRGYNLPMAAELELTLNPAAMKHLLLGSFEHLAPEEILLDLTGEQACQVVPGLPHSIATLLGHMVFWQERRLGWVRGEEQPDPTEALNFPRLTAEQWPDMLQRYFDTLAQFEEHANRQTCARELYEGRSAGFTMASHACHNAYHLGQIVAARRLLGLWPPAPAS